MSYTIVISCKDKPDLLANVLSHIETKYPIEIIVFDIDAVSDRIKKICMESKFNIRRIATNEMGMASCYDMGISIAKYDNVIYCQDDITPTPWCFDRLYETYISQNEYFILSPNIIESTNNLEEGSGIKPIPYSENFSGRVFACFILNKQRYIDIGRLDINFYPVYYEDMDFLYRASLRNLLVGVVLDITVKHAAGSTIKYTIDYSKYLTRNGEYYKKKWGNPPHMEKYSIPFDGKEAIPW
jgi:GT2 family glycosyltransferase